MYWDKNKNALLSDARNSAVVDALQMVSPTTDYQLLETPAGDFTLIHTEKNLPIHNPDGALAEVKKTCRKMLHPGVRSNHIILGLGLGYLMDEVFQQSKGKIFVFEPDLELLRFVLENVDLSEQFGSGRVYLSHTHQAVMAHLKSRYIFGEEVDVLLLNSHAYLMSDTITPLMHDIMTIAEQQKTDINIGFKYHYDWINHFLNNLQHLPVTKPFTPLLGKAKQHPALIISSGPSLDLELDRIKTHQDSFWIIAVGGALRVLLENNITPDFVAFLDFEGPAYQLKNLPCQPTQTRLLLSPFAEDICFTMPFKERYVLNLDNYPYMATYLDSLRGENHPSIPCGGTVSLLATQATIAMGCSPLILCGQDLAFQGTQQYAGNVHAEIKDGKAVIRDDSVTVPREADVVEVEGQNGEVLLTAPDYVDYKKQFESFAKELTSDTTRKTPTDLYNASTGGAQINGFENRSLENIINDMMKKDALKIIEKEAFFTDISDSSSTSSSTFTTTLLENLERLDSSCSELCILADELGTHLNTLIDLAPKKWERTASTYRKTRQAFNAVLDQEQLLSYFLKEPMWQLQQSYIMEPKSKEDHLNNFKTDKHYFELCNTVLSEKIRPVIKTHRQALKEKNTSNIAP